MPIRSTSPTASMPGRPVRSVQPRGARSRLPALPASRLALLRPAKVRTALRRRWFERLVSRLDLAEMDGLVDLGSAYGGWTLPGGLIDSSWTCYLVGAGGDISVDLELIRRFHVRAARSFDAVGEFVDRARADGQAEPAFSAHHAAIAAQDGPLRMQVSHDPQSQSVSAAGLYDSDRFVELPGRTLRSLMAELGDSSIDLLKIDIEGSEYELLPSIDLNALGVKVFATQLHHTGSVAGARGLIEGLRRQGFEPVACRPVVKVTFVRSDLL